MANEAVITVVLKARDEASAEIKNLAQSTDYAQRAFLRAIPPLSRFGMSLTTLLIASGALNNELGRVITRTLAFASTAASTIPAILGLIRVLTALNVTMRATIVVQSILTALSGIGIAKIGAALAVGAGAYAGTRMLMDRAEAGPAPLTIVNNGIMTGDEEGLRRAARQFQAVNREETRLGR